MREPHRADIERKRRRDLGDRRTGHWRSHAWGAGILVAIISNLVNNLPAGLVARSVLAADHVPAQVSGAVLIGVDLGPNLSVTGSLATILWLTALRRERQEVTMLTFLRLGLLVMPPALILSIACMMLSSSP